MLSRSQSVASVVLDHSECAEVFQRHRIDFCCRGELSIEAAATHRGVDADALLDELNRTIESRRGPRDADPRELGTPRLVEHIVETHHDYLRTVLPFVRSLANKVGRVHGDHNPKLRDLDAAVGELTETLLIHLEQEEKELFPALTASVSGQPALAAKLLATMVDEHLAVASLLDRIRAATDDYALPEWACNSYRTLFSELHQMESDILTHVHLENHVLRPRFVPAGPSAT